MRTVEPGLRVAHSKDATEATRVLGIITANPFNLSRPTLMTNAQSHQAARTVLKTVPLVMRSIAAELRNAGELPAPAHYGLLSILEDQPRTLTELATLQGVSLPTMSNSISAMVERGWVTRSSPVRDRRVVIIQINNTGRSVLKRVRHAAETHLAAILLPLSADSGRRVHGGLQVLLAAFTKAQAEGKRRRPREGRRKS